MASFPLKRHIFPTPVHSTSNLKMFPLHWLKFPYDLKLSHNTLVTDEQTDRQTTTNHANNSTVT